MLRTLPPPILLFIIAENPDVLLAYIIAQQCCRADIAQNRLLISDVPSVTSQIFRSLQVHHKYFVGPGDVYGGDYTIYRGGDPSNSHSTATVRVVRQRKVWRELK